MEEKVTMADLLIVQNQVTETLELIEKLLVLIELLHPEISHSGMRGR